MGTMDAKEIAQRNNVVRVFTPVVVATTETIKDAMKEHRGMESLS